MRERAVILFDGVCSLCNGWVRFVIRRDRQRRFKFAPLQSESGKKLLQAHGLKDERPQAVILIEGSRCFVRSDAVLRIVRGLGGWWPLLGALSVIPRGFRDRCYNFVAKHRYRWFGKKETCMVPTEDVADRFLP